MTATTGWRPLPYEQWSDTCDTLHAHTQVLGKLAARLAPAEPQLQHAALRLTARGWETMPLPAPDGSGAIVVTLDLHSHQNLMEHSDGRRSAVALTPDRTVGDVTREVLKDLTTMVGPVAFDARPQEVPWATPLDQDDEHGTYNPEHVAAYLAAATRAAAVLNEVRAPFRGRSTPVNAWWGSFDIAMSLFSGEPADPGSSEFIPRNSMDVEEIAIGWWPGDGRYPHAAFYAYAHPAPPGYGHATIEPAAARWEPDLGEYILDWSRLVETEDPHSAAVTFARAAVSHSCTACGWDPVLSASVEGHPPAVH